MTPSIPTSMRAGRILGPRRTEVATVPVPTPGPGEVLIEVARAGICGTDIHILEGDYALARFPMTPGHEFAGTVVALGDGVRLRHVGERVTADPNLPCGLCPECQRGMVNQCHDLKPVGVARDGAFARYVNVPERVVVPIGDLSFAEGALVEPLACVVWGLERIRVRAGDHALVFGAGPMGCLLIQALKSCGAARVAVVDVAPARLALARTLGADLAITPDELGQLKDLAPLGFELVVEATGIPSVLEGCVEHARPGGTIWVFGVAPGDAMARVSPYLLFRRDLALVGSFAVNQTVPRAVAMIQGGAVKVAPLVSHVLPIESFAEGLRLAAHDPDRMKIQFGFGGPES
jgi:D-arabinitol dehydrogenase (NADP+)